MTGRRVRALPIVLAAAALGTAGCQSTREKSAELSRSATTSLEETGLRVTSANRSASVREATAVSDESGTAIVVSIRNDGAAQLSVPLLVDVRAQDGTPVYRNDGAGLAPSLTSVPALPARAGLVWVNDQVAPVSDPVEVETTLGEPRADRVKGAIRMLPIEGARITGDGTSGIEATGVVRNRTSVEQRDVVVYAITRRADEVTAAGRAVIPRLLPGRSAVFHAFLIGDPDGADLTVQAPATRPDPT